MSSRPRAFFLGLTASANTPSAVVDRLNKEVRAVLTDPPTVARLRGIGVEPVPTSPDEFRRFLRDETKKYAEWVRIARIQLE